MKKYLSRILCLLMALALVFCFAACVSDSDDDDGDKKGSSGKTSEKTSSITGTYYFYEMTQDGETYDLDDLKAELEASGMDIDVEDFICLELNKNGTGTFTYMGQTVDVTWGDGRLEPADGNGEGFDYTASGSKIVLENASGSMTLKK